MNRKAEFNIQGLLIGIAALSLFLGVIGGTVLLVGDNYDITGYDGEQLESLNKMKNISDVVKEAQSSVDGVTVDQDLFDFFSGMWSKIIAPFKVVYRSYSQLISISNTAVDTFKLMPVFTEFFITAIVIVVIIGIVMIKFHLGRSK